jgi:hypothetical protein
LKTLQENLKATGQQAGFTAFKFGEMTGQQTLGFFQNFMQKIRETGDVIGSLKDAFLQFAADFIMQLGMMIIKQIIFNALMAASGGGGFAGGMAQAFAHHDGGVVGSGGTPRSVSPGWFANARRYHSGGIAGLRPNEVPAILERGEEVLTASDPRHSANGGNSNNGGNMEVKVVNAIDAGSFVSAGVEDAQGQKAILNFIRANRNAVKSTLGM